jgi:hypothetical protein
MKAHAGSQATAPVIHTVGIDANEWSASHPNHSTPVKRCSGTHSIDRVGLRASVDS